MSITPVISAFMFLVPKTGIPNKVIVDGVSTDFTVPVDGGFVQSGSESVVAIPATKHPNHEIRSSVQYLAANNK